ncbi:Jasmonate O-methyltransferase [Hordeum vulgare]|nr:Jasmonate O-methyltransferase [Hordeum vulgare]
MVTVVPVHHRLILEVEDSCEPYALVVVSFVIRQSNAIVLAGRMKAIRENMPLLQKAVEQVYTSLSPASVMVIADLGCSSGPNALLIVAEVLGMISDCNQKTNEKRDMELQFFLNDLPSNDFNLVFQSLDQFHNVTRKEEGNEAAAAPYFIVGVPEELSSGNYLNEGNIHIGKTTPPLVANVFREQFQIDFELFLQLRSKELMTGGRMLLTFLGRKSEEMLMHGEIGIMWELLSESLQSLVLKGRVEKEKLDSFNLPLYAPSMEEVKVVINRIGLFHIEHMGPVAFNWDPQDDDTDDDHEVLDPANSGTNVSKSIRSVLEPLIAGHFSEDILDELFVVYASVVAKYLEKKNAKCPSVVVFLKKA